MDQLLDQKKPLSLIVGSGWLSLYEAEHLEAGDVIRFDQTAGYPHRVTYNDRFFCLAEVVICWKNFGMLIVGLRDPEPPSAGFAGAAEDATEFFPVECRLASAGLSIAELRGTGPESLVIFDRGFSTEEDAELLFAGVPVARGKVGVIEENYCLRVTGVSGVVKSGAKPLSSGYRYGRNAPGMRYKDYDFRRPDKFSRSQIASMKMIHETFLRNLSLVLPGAERFEILDVDQMTWSELWPELDKGMRIVRASSGLRSVPLPDTGGKEQAGVRRKLLVVPEGTNFPQTKELEAWIEKASLNKKRKRLEPGVLFAVGRESSLEKQTGEEQFTELVLEPLRQSWKQIAGMDFRFSGTAEDRSGVTDQGENDMILSFILGDRNDPKNRMIIIYPYFTLEPVFSLLDGK